MLIAQPVMLRQPTLPGPVDDGGEAGADDDDDDDDESETEIEAGGQEDDDSDPETETEPARTIMGSMNPLRKKGKGKSKAKNKRPSSGGLGASIPEPVPEEEDAPRRFGAMAKPKLTTIPSMNASTWTLPTPKERPEHKPAGSWTRFGDETPGTARIIPPASSSTAASTSGASDSYFDSINSSSSISVNSVAAQRNVEPVLTQNDKLIPGGIASLGLGAPIEGEAAGPTITEPKFTQSPIAEHEHEEEHEHDEHDHEHEHEHDSEGEDGSDEESFEGSMEAGSSRDHGSGPSVPHSPEAPSTSTVPRTPLSPIRPGLYTQQSRSLVDFRQPASSIHEATPEEVASRREERQIAMPGLETIRSREAAPTKIDLPKPSMGTPGGILSPGSEWTKPPPTPATGFGNFFWAKKDIKDGTDKPGLKRRRSADDVSAAPPKYEPPFPGTFVPSRRDEEGREKLPKYWCAVSHIFHHSQNSCSLQGTYRGLLVAQDGICQSRSPVSRSELEEALLYSSRHCALRLQIRPSSVPSQVGIGAGAHDKRGGIGRALARSCSRRTQRLFQCFHCHVDWQARLCPRCRGGAVRCPAWVYWGSKRSARVYS